MVRYSSDPTPTDKMDKNLSFLQELPNDPSQLTKEDRQKAKEAIETLVNSILLDGNMSSDVKRKNMAVLKRLTDMGLGVDIDNAIAKVTKRKEQEDKTFSPPAAQSHGTLRETLTGLSPKSEGTNGQELPTLGSKRTVPAGALVPPPSEIDDFMNKRYGKRRKSGKTTPTPRNLNSSNGK